MPESREPNGVIAVVDDDPAWVSRANPVSRVGGGGLRVRTALFGSVPRLSARLSGPGRPPVVKLLIERRVLRDVEHEQRRLSLREFLRVSGHAWHGVKLNQPDWSPCSHSVAISAELNNEGLSLHAFLN